MTTVSREADKDYILSAIEDAIDALPFPICVYDHDDRLLVCSQAFRNGFGRAFDGVGPHLYEHELYYKDVTTARLREEFPEDEVEARLAAEIRRHRTKEDYTTDMHLAGHWMRRTKSTSEAGRLIGLAVPIDEIVERAQTLHRVKTELEHQATHDPLTDLPNRRALSDHLARVFGDLDKLRGGVAVLHVDLDKFKLVNDTLGHDAGDKVLIEAAKILRSEVRATDFVARVGGDEFVLVCTDIPDEEDVANIAGRIVEKMAEPIYYGEEICQIGASIGVVLCTEHANPDQTLMDADIALYESKKGGRGRYAFFYPRHRDQFTAQQKKIVDVREAIALNAFEPFFQPQVCVRTGAFLGFEALARWNDRETGFRKPASFLGAVQEAHLANELDAMMMRKTLKRLRTWDELELEVPRVSLNLSTDRLNRATLVDEFKWACDESEISYERVCIEILESVAVGDENGVVINNIQALSKAGFHIALDDFGTGQASISGLRLLRPDEIKIDQEFVSGIDKDRELQIMTGAMISLAQTLDIDILCEGVETQGELDTLLHLGCTRFQGYVTAKPMDSETVPIWLTQFNAGWLPLARVA